MELIEELARNQVWDHVSDSDAQFEHFVGVWEQRLQPESGGWPVAPAFEEFKNPADEQAESSQSQSA